MSQGFPRVYRTGLTGRLLYLACGMALFAAGLAGGVLFLVLADDPVPSKPGAAGFCAVLVLLGLYVIVAVLRGRVVLEADAIEVHGTFWIRRLRREEIAGRRRLHQNHGQPFIRLMPRSVDEKALTLDPQLKTDAAFDAWLKGIPDLDGDEAQASLDAMLADPDLLGTREEKLAALARAQRVANYFVWATLVIALWLGFYPHPYDLAVACAVILPWIAVLLAARSPLYRLHAKRNEVHANLGIPLWVPGFVLAARAAFDFHLFDGNEVLVMTVVATALCLLVVLGLVRELRQHVLATSVFILVYAFGAAALANVRLDRHEPDVYEAPVLNARVQSGRDTQYYLELGPWGPRTVTEAVEVGKDYYARGATRKTVCVFLHRGALRVRWFEVADCPREARGSP